MNKSPEAFRTISEVAETLDVPPHVLRFWETRFPQIKPVKRGGGRRYYRPEDVRLLRGIRGLLYDDGMTIKGVQKILRERGLRHVIGLGTVAGDEELAPVEEPVVAEAEAKVEAPAKPVREHAPESVPQEDLFATGGAQVMEAVQATAVPSPGTPPPAPRDKVAIRALLVKLQALRSVMID